MGGMMSRQKGKSGEREVAALLTELTGYDVRRRVRQHLGDSDLEGLTGWSVEVKRYASATPALLKTWWLQAVQQSRATNVLPVLFFRVDRSDWRAVWAAELHLSPRPSTLSASFDDTLTATPETWWHLVKGMHKCA